MSSSDWVIQNNEAKMISKEAMTVCTSIWQEELNITTRIFSRASYVPTPRIERGTSRIQVRSVPIEPICFIVSSLLVNLSIRPGAYVGVALKEQV
jgi:hypothetical protein